MLALVHLLFALTVGAPQTASDSLTIDIAGRTAALTGNELAALARDSVTWSDHGTSHTYTGVPLVTVLRRIGVPIDKLHGADLTKRVVVEAADHYRAVFTVAEIAPGIGDRDVLLADQQDGRPLPPTVGPRRLVVPGDGSGARSVRQVITLRVRDEP